MFKINTKKLTVFVLILILIVTAIFVAGCKSEPSGSTDTTTAAANPPDGDTGETEEVPAEQTKYVADYLPDANYGGYEFRMVAPSGYGVIRLFVFADVEEENGDTLNDAIYKRNRLIEQQFNIKFKQIETQDWSGLSPVFKRSVQAQSDEFDLCMIISREAWAAALDGLIMPVHDLPYVDITQPWYSHDVNKEITINGKLYFAYSDECLNMFAQTSCVLFNKQMAADLALENMYNLVRDGKWTTDKFFTFAKAAVADLDGDGQMTDIDRYGILTQNDMLLPAFWVASGIKTVSKDADDLLVFTGDNEKLYTILEKVHQNLYAGDPIMFDTFKDKVTSFENTGGDDMRRVSQVQFENNHGLFFVRNIGAIPQLRAMDTDFGVLPFPKNDENQERYYSRVIDGWINCVPNTAEDVERTSLIMEALAVESKNITMPAYYEINLRTKHSRDDESSDMIELVAESRTIDIGAIYYLETVLYTYEGVFNSRKNNFASAVEKNLSRIEKALSRANDAALLLD